MALLVTLSWLAMMVALISEFTYGTTVDAAQAANARDELRAHYLARSSVSLARLLIRIQQRFVEPVMKNVQDMFSKAMSGATGSTNPFGSMGISLRITDYAGTLMGFFGGDKDEVSALGGLIGLDTSAVKGLGLKTGKMDAEITPDDGRIDINCGSGMFSGQQARQLIVFRLLTGMMGAPRYDKLFSEQDANGQVLSRVEIARAIIDWADMDEQMFSPDGASGGENYLYDARADRYRAHDNSYDTVEEVALVRGVSESWLQAFQPYLTVYGHDAECRVNLGAIGTKNGVDCTPIMMGIIRAAAMPDWTKPPADPSVLDDRRLYPLASLACERASASGFTDLDQLINILTKPTSMLLPDDPRYQVMQSVQPLTINKNDLGKVAYVGPVRTYRIVATGEAGRVKKKITAIVDTKGVVAHPMTLNTAAEQAAGVLQYWREE